MLRPDVAAGAGATPAAFYLGLCRLRVVLSPPAPHDHAAGGTVLLCRHDGAALILDFKPRLANRCIDSGDLLGFRASILDFRPKLGNRCTDSGHFWGFPAVILDFRPKLRNRCIDSGDLLVFRAVILDFRPKLGNRCTDSGDFRGFHAVILDFRPRLGNRCSNGGLQAKPILVAAMKLELDAEIVAATAAEVEIFR